ncbi:MAG: BrnA antitoxin family protein [Patescibacteria group bacterium]
MIKQKIKKIPKFKTEDEERDFWAKNSPLDYFNMSNPIVNPLFPNLKPSTKTISLRLPANLLDGLKILANKKDVPYQSMMKMFLAEKLEQEQKLSY